MEVIMMAIHGPLNHRVKIFCKPALKQTSSNMPGNKPIIIKEIIYFENELILIRAASSAALEFSIALNFAAHFMGMGIILFSSPKAPDKGNVRNKIASIMKTCL